MSFSEARHSQQYMCTCIEQVVNRVLEFDYDRLFDWFPFLDGQFISFAPGICHRCVDAVPQCRYTHPMYGNLFIVNYGWYCDLLAFERSFFPECFFNGEAPYDIDRYTNEYRTIENEVRKHFGFSPVGSRNISETLLYKTISDLFYKREVIHRHRPKWCDGMEIDIYIPSLALAFEYQGKQHYKPMNLYGGEEGLARIKASDKRKVSLCKRNGVKLLKYHHSWEITYERVISRLPKTTQCDLETNEE